MNGSTRREHLLQDLRNSDGPVSASALAKRYGVSRQIIVGDIALLRAGGVDIASTARGYRIPESREAGLIRRVACRHTAEETAEELNAIVDQGCAVLDVIVEHPVYSDITGRLDIRSRHDVEQFVDRCRASGAQLLSALTDGVHLHTLSCPDEESFQRARDALSALGFLIPEE